MTAEWVNSGSDHRTGMGFEILTNIEKRDGAAEGEFNALGMIVVDAILDHDETTLEVVMDGAKRIHAIKRQSISEPWALEQCGRLLGFIDVMQWASRRIVPLAVRRGVARDSHAYAMLTLISTNPGCNNLSLAAKVGVDPTEIARVGSKLSADGLARKIKIGTANRWEITPRGRQALNLSDAQSEEVH